MFSIVSINSRKNGSSPILSVIHSIDTMLNNNGPFFFKNATCKQGFSKKKFNKQNCSMKLYGVLLHIAGRCTGGDMYLPSLLLSFSRCSLYKKRGRNPGKMTSPRPTSKWTMTSINIRKQVERETMKCDGIYVGLVI